MNPHDEKALPVKTHPNPLTEILGAYREKTLPDPLTLPQQLDITGAEMVQVEIDHHRKVLYVHVDGYTALRICRIKEILPTINNTSPSVDDA